MVAYSYPAILEPDEDGRLVVRFPDLPEALTDGADEAEALHEAADCLSEALASRIVDGEEIPAPGPLTAGQYLISPDPTIALKAALYDAMRAGDVTVADLAERLGMGDWHQAARLLDPRRSSKLTGLAAALGTLGRRIAVSVEADPAGPVQIEATASASIDAGARTAVGLVYEELARGMEKLEIVGHALPRLASERRRGRPAPRKLRDTRQSLSDATLEAVQAHGEGATAQDVMDYLNREFGMSVRPNHLGVALQRHRRAGRLENRDQRWHVAAKTDA